MFFRDIVVWITRKAIANCLPNVFTYGIRKNFLKYYWLKKIFYPDENTQDLSWKTILLRIGKQQMNKLTNNLGVGFFYQWWKTKDVKKVSTQFLKRFEPYWLRMLLYFNTIDKQSNKAVEMGITIGRQILGIWPHSRSEQEIAEEQEERLSLFRRVFGTKIVEVNAVSYFRFQSMITAVERMVPVNSTITKQKEQMLNIIVKFTPNSPQTENFSQRYHYYDWKTRDYIKLPIRGWGGKRIKAYTYRNVAHKTILRAINPGIDYGKDIFHQKINKYHYNRNYRGIIKKYARYWSN